ncbi:MAG: SDR family oxidoreductase [Anaerolineae bacterium]|jgi:3-oxoacyl-[acyl-carrier protein] reductase|nr:SDR family oxidoreductase [Anaerolineae bacterium]MBT7071226.1 SDR family oxidoreductase [Anaerolineae bacterium]MBT7324191.1 SDR family oxidoreductase [Anaerolineae bacterium]
MDLGLKGKRALVTGASRGLGYAVAATLAEEGCHVAISSRNVEKLSAAAKQIEEAHGIPVAALPADMNDASTLEELITNAVDALGGLDLLVTNAGGPPPGKFETFSEEAWVNAIDLSFLGHVRLIRAALPYLRKSDAASVLTITSYSVKQPVPDLVLSNSIRAATVGLTKSLSNELGEENIRFNSILPGWTKTERVTQLMDARAQTNGTSIDEQIAKQAAESALGRMGEPHEFANPAVFLLSPAASYITGVSLLVDGGISKGIM